MKIIDIELRQYRWERGTPIRNGKHTYTHSGLNLICVHTDAGVSGIGWGAQAADDRHGQGGAGIAGAFQNRL